MNYILFEDETRGNLLPFTLTRPVPEIRVGVLTIADKWRRWLQEPVSYLTERYLSVKYRLLPDEENILINGSIIPDAPLVKAIQALKAGQELVKNNLLLAAFVPGESLEEWKITPKKNKRIPYEGAVFSIRNLWDMFMLNEKAIRYDVELLTAGRKSAPIPSSNQVISPENIFIEAGAKVECAILNASTGPIYISKAAEIMEGCMIRGPFTLGEGATMKMGAKIYGATSIGPHCKVGGEVGNSVIFGFSNKAHDGFLGNSVIGEWCNLGADTNNSNLKNNYSNVKIWNYPLKEYVDTGMQFCGLFMGDHSKSGINTMFNTGTVVGVSCNVFGSGFPEKLIPSFSWGGADAMESFRLDKAIELAQQVYKRRQLLFDETETAILTYLYLQNI